jgi:Ca-activated chloride channel family protein
MAAAAIVLAAGGLVLARSSGSAAARPNNHPVAVVPSGSNTASFSGPGAHGTIALSHTKVLAHGGDSLFAEVKLTADKDGTAAKERAPLALAVVLDTSGSMEGEKIERAKDSVLTLIRDMRDDDQIAFVRYSSDAEVVQSLARLGDVRETLESRVRALRADGGTNIPSGLDAAAKALREASGERVRRIVLASDGLDSTRQQAEHLASDCAERGVTVSSMGIGLDFDEGYMSAVARDGHGNFGFVNDGPTLATFLRRELDEAASTTIADATIRVTLPKGVRFVRASGADARAIGPGGFGGSDRAPTDGEVVELKMGALYAGDERRALLELASDLDVGESRTIAAAAAWHRVGGADAKVDVPALSLVATSDAREVQRGEDGTVLASATSVIASRRELEASEAYAHGDQARARALIQQNVAAIATAAAAAPAPAASALAKQAADYESQLEEFKAAPTSTAGKSAAKKAVAKDSWNLSRSAY